MKKYIVIKIKKRRKYGNHKVEWAGLKFDSKKEARRWWHLDVLQKAGYIKFLKHHVKFDIDVNGIHVCSYIADFVYYDCNKCANVVEDVKGVKTAIYRLKKKLMKACHNVDILET